MLLPDANSAQAITITSRPTHTAHQSSVEKRPPPPRVVRSVRPAFAGCAPAGRLWLVSLIAKPREVGNASARRLVGLDCCEKWADPAKYSRATAGNETTFCSINMT